MLTIAGLLYFVGELLSNSLTNLCNMFGLPELVLGILLGFITSIPELITFIEAQRKEKKKDTEMTNKIGVIEATNNLLTSNLLNLFVIQSIGTIIYTIIRWTRINWKKINIIVIDWGDNAMWGKQEDKNRDLIVNILKTKMELNLNIKNYEYAEQDQIDYFLYQIKANQARLDFLIKKAKESNIELSNIEKIKYEA